MALSFRVSPGVTIPLPPNLSASVDYVPKDAIIHVPATSGEVSNSHAKACYYHVKFAMALEVNVYRYCLGIRPPIMIYTEEAVI